jgi:hypothetical protein
MYHPHPAKPGRRGCRDAFALLTLGEVARTRAVATALAIVASVGVGCIPPPPPPPTAGYGPPYRGTGEGIYVEDRGSRWEVTEGQHPLTSEQALEASGDAEYEARRQVAKDYNVRLYREALAHRKLGTVMIAGGAAAAAAGIVLARQTETTASTIGDVVALTGLVVMLYGYYGGKRPPPYHAWRTPEVLDRPAYVRQQTEPYNEKIGAPTIRDQAGKAPAAARHPMHGDRR